MHNELFSRGTPSTYKQQYIEDKTGYTDVKESTKDLLEDTRANKTIEYNKVGEIKFSVSDYIKEVEPALIFQCINGNNQPDEYLHRHSTNVAMINGLMGSWLGLSQDEINDLITIGIVHDIGKVQVPPEILHSPNKLTDEEFKIMKLHTVFSDTMIKENKAFEAMISKASRHHHEKMNGTGYPDGIRADEIPFYSRITSISDIYDAMVSKRVYKKAESPFVVLAQMKAEQFSGLDIRLVNLFTEQMPRELLGQKVLMSNGTTGIVRFVNDKNILYPYVDIDGELVVTNKDIYCESMIIDERV
jgi:HD-GYP domain-containing protein (c-di-GMP phosphodiesterase class II)